MKRLDDQIWKLYWNLVLTFIAGDIISKEVTFIYLFIHLFIFFVDEDDKVSCNKSFHVSFRFGLVWFGLVLWHINLYRLFNAKSIFM